MQETSITKEEGRDLTEVDLKTYLQESSHTTKTTASMSRVASFSILASLDHKMKKGKTFFSYIDMDINVFKHMLSS